jgi:hypothetical protein
VHFERYVQAIQAKSKSTSIKTEKQQSTSNESQENDNNKGTNEVNIKTEHSEHETGNASDDSSMKDTKEIKEDKPEPGSIVRGRVYTEGKSVTFNKLWTAEEQKRLEELLEIYPDEPISSRRWSKIAQALGNRTPKQVASRTQKYFIKLAKQGKPVPGKMPNMEARDDHL